MTKLTALVFGIFIVLASFNIAEAHHNDGLKGLVIGGVGGAAIGHVITGTQEGMIFGSFLGGTIGMLIDAENDRHNVVIIKDRHRHHRDWRGHSYRGRWPHRGDRHYYGRHGHKHHKHPRDHYRGRHLR